ncbi:MKI67 FHA domain-interacting nucleolar phosphoprotein-like [Anabrus simplex]|uniref:MKI67 FHA domain-interacting nucleolar phosphoprotein-like n=1 Tax=Anabrus simplex TaxID=316456 RepID=UPI0034DDAAD7
MSSKKVSVKKSSQSVFTRAVKYVKKRQNFIKVEDSKDDVKVIKPAPVASEDESRGIVYLSHIPPGFYENEMRKYFNQFGHVTRIKLARSKKTGKSKGYAFIEFRYAEVAKVVAETMNNYLMCSRLLKASFTDKKYSNNFWKPVTPSNCPTARNRRRDIMIKNSLISPAKELQFAKNKKKKLDNLLEKLHAKGIDYDFQPSDDVEMQVINSDQRFVQDEEPLLDSTNIPIFEVDESDSEIDFKTPPNVIKKVLKRKNAGVEIQTPITVKPTEGCSTKKKKKKLKSSVNVGTPQKSCKKAARASGKPKTRIPVLKGSAGIGKIKGKIAVVRSSKKKV